MKPILYLLLSLVFYWPLTLYSQTNVQTWEKQTQIRGLDFYTDVLEDVNKGFTVLGAKTIAGRSLDFWIVRYAENGDTIWTKCLGTEKKDIPKKIIQLADKGYIVTGSSKFDDKTVSIVYKLDENGTELWNKSFADQGFVNIEDLIPNGDGFTVVGSKGVNLENSNLWLANFSIDGEIESEKSFDQDLTGSLKSIKLLPDGGLALAGNINEKGKKDCDIIILRIDAKGEVAWNSRIKTPGKKVWPECICCSPDSCFMVVGWQGNCLNDINSEYPVFDFDLVMNKIDCDGNVVWSKSFDKEGSEGGNAIAVLPDGSCLVAGVITTSFLGKIGPWLIHADSQGNALNEKLLNMHMYQPTKILRCNDGSFIMVGPGMYEQINSRTDGWIMRFNNL
ncbi:MAG: hypothetical protein R3182_04490 [Draconibacterium sp.]|nr:hypothetical protein [Draconibacterium sp.]